MKERPRRRPKRAPRAFLDAHGEPKARLEASDVQAPPQTGSYEDPL